MIVVQDQVSFKARNSFRAFTFRSTARIRQYHDMLT